MRSTLPADFVGPPSREQMAPTKIKRFRGTQSTETAEARLAEAQRAADMRNAIERANAATAEARAAAAAAKPGPRDRYQIQPDGKGGLVRVDLDTGIAIPVQMPQGVAVPVKPPPKTPAQIEAESKARATGTAKGKADTAGGLAGIVKRIFGSQESSPTGASGVIRARDPQGTLHEAPAGTALPPGWKLEGG